MHIWYVPCFSWWGCGAQTTPGMSTQTRVQSYVAQHSTLQLWLSSAQPSLSEVLADNSWRRMQIHTLWIKKKKWKQNCLVHVCTLNCRFCSLDSRSGLTTDVSRIRFKVCTIKLANSTSCKTQQNQIQHLYHYAGKLHLPVPTQLFCSLLHFTLISTVLQQKSTFYCTTFYNTHSTPLHCTVLRGEERCTCVFWMMTPKAL